jgi:SNF2 family DNA or RNA helicase
MIASFLGLKLGVDSFAPEATNADNFKNIRSELSAFEKFRSYQEKHSYCWHKRRHDLAQSFLDLFVRQNTAQVNDIKCFPSIEPVVLSVDHAVIQEELYQHLSFNETNISKKREDSTSDEGHRINLILTASRSADEALLRSCAVLNTSISNCDDRILKRKKELNSLKSELAEQIALAENLKGRSNEKELNLYHQWLKKQQFGDPESNKTLQELHRRVLKATTKASSSQTTLRVLVDKLEVLGRNLTARIRSLRRLESLNRLQYSLVGQCDDTHCTGRCPVSSMQIITACGHMACLHCLSTRNEPGRCIVLGCGAEVLDLHVRSREFFGVNMQFSRQQTFGAKLDTIIELIQYIPEDDQLLLFLQSKDLIQDVKDCLENFEISYHCLDKTAKENLAAIEHFQETRGKAAKKVLILLLAGEQASGLNLTNANHIVFLSPLLAKTQYEYEANMKQAIRRARRYGQEKPVHVYHFVNICATRMDGSC